MESNQTVEGGHRWQLDKRGEIDEFYWDDDRHYGPMCKECYASECVGCHPEIWKEKCDVVAIRPFLPLEF